MATSQFDFTGGESHLKFKSFFPFVTNNSTVTLNGINIQGLASYKHFPNRLPSLNNQQQSYNFALKDGFQSVTLTKSGFEKPNLSQFKEISLTESDVYKYNPPQEKVKEVIEEDISVTEKREKSILGQCQLENIKIKPKIQNNSEKVNRDQKFIDPNNASATSKLADQLRLVEEQEKKEMEKKKADERKRWEAELFLELQKRNLDNK